MNEKSFCIITLHRPSNVDNFEVLSQIIDLIINEISLSWKVIWPIHPRTKKNLQDFALFSKLLDSPNIIILHPISYHEMLRLNYSAKFFITDSGGLQEECCVLGTPCITMRYNTERPITLSKYGGVSSLVGNDIESLKSEISKLDGNIKKPFIPPLWDGNTANRILNSILNY